MIRPLALLLVVGSTLLAAAAPRNDDSQKLVFLSEAGPILLELNVKIDGKSFRAAHRDFLDRLFVHLDRNDDGVLSRREAERAPAPAALLGPGRFFGGPRGRARMDANGDGEVTPRELREHYEKAGLVPFSISFVPRQTGVVVLNNVRSPNASADAINTRIFELLDANKDGRLSKKELEAAPTILARLDEDENEVITVAELQGDAAPGNGEFQAIVDRPLAMPASGPRPFVMIGENAKTPGLGKRLLEHYGRKGAMSLTRKQINLSTANFERLDRNENGALDVGELDRLGVLSADAAFTVRLGKKGEKDALVEARKSNRWVDAKPAGDGVLLQMGNVALELRGPAPVDNSLRFNFDPREQYINQFRGADADNNGYLDKMEADQSPFFRSTFAIMDTDGDGKLYEKEMLAYVDRQEKLRGQAGRCCLTLTVMDDGKGLFERLDLDGDGRLSVRELRQVPKLLDALDRNGDGALSQIEVPRRYKGTFDLGPSVGGELARRAIVFRSGMDGAVASSAMVKGPLWFRKMDRNRDGDVSRAEWLGNEEEFKAADADGDGLISLAEAERYDAAKRTKNE